MATLTTHIHDQQAYCVFSQKAQCLGYPSEPDHPACNCIYIFVDATQAQHPQITSILMRSTKS